MLELLWFAMQFEIVQIKIMGICHMVCGGEVERWYSEEWCGRGWARIEWGTTMIQLRHDLMNRMAYHMTSHHGIVQYSTTLHSTAQNNTVGLVIIVY